MEWQPIETAPKDETRVLVTVRGFMPCVGWWFIEAGKWMTTDAEDYDDDGAWEHQVSNTEYRPTHWMPLPEAPNTEVRGDAESGVPRSEAERSGANLTAGLGGTLGEIK